ncbi:MAG TPA: hypothetical protein VIH99_03125 [Bdellovibrionota bacterium]|jgi:hypothetical protein
MKTLAIFFLLLLSPSAHATADLGIFVCYAHKTTGEWTHERPLTVREAIDLNDGEGYNIITGHSQGPGENSGYCVEIVGTSTDDIVLNAKVFAGKSFSRFDKGCAARGLGIRLISSVSKTLPRRDHLGLEVKYNDGRSEYIHAYYATKDELRENLQEHAERVCPTLPLP